MLAAERKELLVAQLARDGRLVARDAALALGTSEDTVRRDLRELAAEGRLQRVHGGALPVSPALASFAARRGIEPSGKAAVAAVAAQLVRPGQTVLVNGGTTTLALVRSLDPTLVLTVATHSPTIAVALADHPGIEVELIGGRLYKHSVVTCGAQAAEAARLIRADVFFMGITGVHPGAGLTTGDAEEAAMKRTLAGQAAETYALASAEKVGAVSPHLVLPCDRVTAVIADSTADIGTVADLRRQGVEVIVAPPVGRVASG